jgi:tRNA G46 methylase TrmB
MSLIKHKLAKVVLPIPVPLNGLQMLGPCLQIVKNQRHEPEITEFLRNSTNKQTIFCDVGAAYGFHTLMMAREMKKVSKKVWAFEPSQKDRRLLLANLKLNNLNNYTIVKIIFEKFIFFFTIK